ncbi:WD40 repeat domain-containing protein [Nonomuraea sp. JJY05]|uniref:WD40 repeat domain-containing protein n=1 Tax=Nonomuraea sp. JJY05 TaxID=3350255 RepID=UPI00373E7B4C
MTSAEERERTEHARSRPGSRRRVRLPWRRSGARPGSLPDRVLLDEVLERAVSPQAAVQELLGERQLWWKCCGEAVRADPSWLYDERCEALRGWLDETAPDRTAGSAGPTDHAWLLGRALSAPEGQDGGHDGSLAGLAEGWSRSGLVSADAAPGPAQPSGKGLEGLPPRLARQLANVVEWIRHWQGGTAGAGSVLLIAALLMAGARPRGGPVRVPVVFGRTAGPAGPAAVEDGVTGVLELREFPPGPAGLYPDPRAMAGVRSPNSQFAGSLAHAWNAAGPRREGRCVLWRLVLSDDPVPPTRIEGPSLGAAFALALRELVRHPATRRPSLAGLRGLFYGLRPRTAVTGALDGGERLLKVSDMDAKLTAARRKGLRLVAPEANRLDVAKAPEPGEVRFATTLRQADRYARRLRTGRMTVVLAMVAAVATTAVVVSQREAAALRQLTAAHRLAEVSQSLLGSDVGLAELFAVRAYRLHPDSLTRSALFQAVTASPHLAGSMQASGPVSALSSSADERVVLSGTKQGQVEQWVLAGSTAAPARRLGRLPGPVTAVAADARGDTVAAIDHDTVRVWAAAQPVAAPAVAAGHHPTAVGVSPSGRFVAVTTSTEQFGVPGTLRVLDRTTGKTRHRDLDLQADPSDLAFSGDASVVAFEDAYGSWTRISLPAPARTAGSTVGFGVHNLASALAPDGSSFSYTNGASTLPIWPSQGTPDIEKPDRQARTRAGNQAAALALSSGGEWAAKAVGTSIHVSRTAVSGRALPAAVTLTGAGLISRDSLAFLGHGSRLLSASGDVLNLWDLGRRSRIATETEAIIPASCNACTEPFVALSPDGRTAAVLSGEGTALDLSGLDPPGTRLLSEKGSFVDSPEYTAALWHRDGNGLIVMSVDGSAKILSRAQGFRAVGRWPAVPNPHGYADPPVLLRHLPDGRQVAELDGSGTVRFRDAATGRVLREVDGPRSMAPTESTPSSWFHRGSAALDPKAGHAAVIDRHAAPFQPESVKTIVTDLATGRSRTIPGADAVGVAYAGDRLLVQRQGGALEVWTASGDRRLDTIEGTPDTIVGPAVGGQNLIAEKPAEDTVRLIDLQSGHVMGTLALPAAGTKAASTGLAISADGATLVTATERVGTDVGVLITWQLDPNAWVGIACASTGRDLGAGVWRQYMGTDAPPDLRCRG